MRPSTTRTRRAVDWLRATTCPACSTSKGSGKSFCYRCFKSLRPKTRNDLYQSVGEGYEVAVEVAMEELTGRADALSIDDDEPDLNNIDEDQLGVGA